MENGKFPALFFLLSICSRVYYNKVCEEAEYNHQYFINYDSCQKSTAYKRENWKNPCEQEVYWMLYL